MISKDSVWFITGSSRGLGRALAEEALANGYRVVATARRTADLDDLVAAHGDMAHAVALDVTDEAARRSAIAAAEARFGSIDVLVNNAGYGYLGAIEEGEDTAVRAMFETDLFAPIKLTQAVLPAMRARRRGHIVNITSIGGLVTFPGFGYYHMAKFALEAMSDTLAKELAPLGIGVTAVAPGAFRTDFRGDTSMVEAPTPIGDYDETVGKTRERTQAGHRKQVGDPVRGARAIIAAIEADNPPVHLLIGGDALGLFRARLDAMRQETDAWEAVTSGTDLPPGEAC